MDTTSVALSEPDAHGLTLHTLGAQRRMNEQEWLSGEGLRLEALSLQLDEAHRQLNQQRMELAAQEAGLDQRLRRLEHALKFVDQQQAEIDAQRLRLRSQRRRVGAALKQRKAELRDQLDQFQEALATSDDHGAETSSLEASSQIAELQRQRDELLLRLKGAEDGPTPSDQKAEDEKAYELRRRFEMAVEDMRAYKLRVAELEEQLAHRPKSIEKPAAGGPLNWAQQKANMLASLETDMGGSEPKNIDDRLTVEGAVRITDEVVADKDRELLQLRRQLEDLKAERTTANSHDAGVAAILDHDAVIAAERERLRKLQESMLDKQRTAEVELSMERAKLARQRVEMEDRLHAMESDIAHRQANNASGDNSAPVSRSLRGRWLARLGLKDGDGVA